MNSKGIAVVVGVAIVILAVVILPIKPNGVPPAIEDAPKIEDGFIIELDTGTVNEIEINEDVSIKTSSDASDVLDITDAATMEQETSLKYYYNDEGIKYYIDENGTKHYLVTAEDVQTIKEQGNN